MNIHPMEAEARCPQCDSPGLDDDFKDPSVLVCQNCGERIYRECDSDDGCSR